MWPLGLFQMVCHLSDEAAGAKGILRKYGDRRIDLADACLSHLADEFGTGDILTLDGDFGVYRWGEEQNISHAAEDVGQEMQSP